MDPVENKEVKKEDQNASTDQQDVKKEESGASADQKDDLAAQLEAKDAEIAKLAIDRDNYKKGLLIAKGKLPADEPDDDGQQPDDVDTKIQKAVHDALFSEKEKALMAEKEALFQQALKENKEMKIALGNKQGISTTIDGGASDTKTTTTQYFSDDQIRDLKARGWDDAKIKKAAENLQAKK